MIYLTPKYTGSKDNERKIGGRNNVELQELKRTLHILYMPCSVDR